MRPEVQETARHNPFSGWPVLGETWHLGIETEYLHGYGPGLACFVRPELPLGVPLLDLDEARRDNSLAQCPLGFFCPFLNTSNPDTWPVLCPPNTYCEMFRLMGNRCMVAGCANIHSKTVLTELSNTTSPEGHYCPSGSITPHKCRIFSYCPTGSIGEINYGMILLCLAIDVLVFVYLIIFTSKDCKKQGVSAWTGVPFYNRWEDYAAVESADYFHNDTCDLDQDSDIMSVVSNVLPLVTAFQTAFHGLDNLRMNLKFNRLKYSLGEKVVLDGISGEMQSGKMTAILGPSGAGKTTFMNVLMGKLARSGGQISINGIPSEMHTFRKMIGHVPQDDIMLQELTVREVIEYSAKARLPRDWSSQQVNELVNSILKVLSLEHIAHAIIGDELNRGISGGQRKRVNIAMELASAPLAIFLDEPTSGLDSTAALKVSQILRSISRVGLTVVAIVHQPRIEIFKTFDDVLMIGPGGKTAYFGPVKQAQSYFENSLNFVFGKESNPADVLMDILSGRGKMKHGGPSMEIDAIAKFWRTSGCKLTLSDCQSDNCSPSAVSTIPPISMETVLQNVRTLSDIVNVRGASFLQQLWNAHSRSLIQQARMFGHLAIELWVATLSGLIMGVAGRADEMYHGVLVAPYQQLSSTPNEWFLGLYGTLIGVAVAVAGGPAGVRLFGEEKLIYWREAASGHNALAYYLGKNISVLYRVALAALHFTGVYVLFSKPTFSLVDQYVLIFLNFLCIYGIAAVISMITRRENASLLTVVLGLLCAIFDGFAPSLRDARKAGVEFLFAIFPNRYAAEAQYSLSLGVYSHIYDLQYATEYFGYELNKTARNMFVMVALALGYRVLGFILMVCMHRDKQR
ncbi:hypothetical protein BJ741DRAFT_535436 [Chytriomyces cf. hyalinus JEL632]|nr:hypothetical protein BJ741DRAFT_535436 [Chytriomyces cf. hyalinus JEL632]